MTTESKARRLAIACRALASECEAGTGPALGAGTMFRDDRTPCCSLGHVTHRADIPVDDAVRGVIRAIGADWREAPSPIRGVLEEVAFRASFLVNVNDAVHDEARAKAVVEPLRRLADALDAWDRATTGG